jgi:hypothetical protein
MWANTEYSPEGYRVSIYRTCTPHMEQRSERGQRPNPISSVSCVSSVVLMGRETGSLHLLAPLLLTGGKGADLVIRGNVFLNSLHLHVLASWNVGSCCLVVVSQAIRMRALCLVAYIQI